MIYFLTLLVTALAGLVVWAQARTVARRERAWERRELEWSRERAELTNKIMFLADKPFELPPEPEPEPEPEEEEEYWLPEQEMVEPYQLI